MTTPLLFILVILPCVTALYDVEEPAESSYQFDLSYDDINISTSCSKALHKLFMLESTQSPLMLRYWDSWGKPSHGILEGHTSYLGYYDECINLKDTDFGETDYCIYAMQMNLSTIQAPIPIQVGVCYPSACSSQEFARILSEMDITSVITVIGNPFSTGNNTISVSINSDDKSATFCPQTDEDYDVSTILVLIACGVIVVMVMVGTMVDIILWLLPTDLLKSPQILRKYNGSIQNGSIQTSGNENGLINEKDPLIPKQEQKGDRPTVKDFILAFSLYNTVPVLVSMKQSPSAIKALSGIRFHAITLIVMEHVSAFFPVYHGLIQNPWYANELLARFLLQPISNASLAVESFFLLSAFLSSYLTFKDIEKNKKFRYLYFYLHRYFRISPLLYLYTIISINLVYHFAQGPLWSFSFLVPCKDNWWYNLLYLGNVNDANDICFGVSWYLFVDMQLYILSPIIILLLYRYWYIGLMVISLVMIGATTVIGVQAGVSDDYYANVVAHPENIDQTTDLYMKPHYRVNTYLIGILLGYIFYKKYWITNLSINKWLKFLIYIVLWVAATVLCTTTMFGAYNDDEFSKSQTIMYLMFNGPAWSIGLSIIIYICNTGYGGVVNSYLSWPVWEPLAKMTFGVYLCHIIIISIMYGTFQSTVILTDYIYAILCVFIVVTSFAWSGVTFVFLELPVSKVVSLCFKLFGMDKR
ncbi:nose resistant to fluoxetine protein 6-like [Dysidea avara]|uniref:nose resistant to fluoxetine protein 6-like n=1 Tax=Dysidea avara TaxID=196820 RepID=UPI003321ABDB